jgi:lysophospholipase L1-like esterase
MTPQTRLRAYRRPAGQRCAVSAREAEMKRTTGPRSAVLVTALAGLVAMALGLAPSASASATVTVPHRYYLALGDSLAYGYQPNAPAPLHRSGHGYTDDLAAVLSARAATAHAPFTYTDLGCPGETSTTFLVGPCPAPHSYSTQLAAATDFLTAHRGDPVTVTLDIGANDVDGCLTASGPDISCVLSGIASATSNLNTILSKLQAVAGPQTRFVGSNLYDPFLASWRSGTSGIETAAATLALVNILNPALSTVFALHGVPVADVATAFGTNDVTPVLYQGQLLPHDVALTCKLTWMCTFTPPNIHPTDAGYTAMAGAFLPLV